MGTYSQCHELAQTCANANLLFLIHITPQLQSTTNGHCCGLLEGPSAIPEQSSG